MGIEKELAIGKLLEIVRKDVERYVENQTSSQLEDKVVLANLINQDGSVGIPKDTIAMTLINIAKDDTKGGYPNRDQYGQGPVNINLYIMFSAYFNTYMEALKHIEYVLRWFQLKSVYTLINTPNLPVQVGNSLNIELIKMDFDQLSHLWGMLGGKYIPSVVYRMRTISIHETRKSSKIPSIGN